MIRRLSDTGLVRPAGEEVKILTLPSFTYDGGPEPRQETEPCVAADEDGIHFYFYYDGVRRAYKYFITPGNPIGTTEVGTISFSNPGSNYTDMTMHGGDFYAVRYDSKVYRHDASGAFVEAIDVPATRQDGNLAAFDGITSDGRNLILHGQRNIFVLDGVNPNVSRQDYAGGYSFGGLHYHDGIIYKAPRGITEVQIIDHKGLYSLGSEDIPNNISAYGVAFVNDHFVFSRETSYYTYITESVQSGLIYNGKKYTI